MVVREHLVQDYRMLANQHSEELTQLLEDFVESQEDISQQLMELGNKSQRAEELKRVEAITIPDNDSAEQNEPKPNPSDGLEVTTVPRNPSED